MVELLAETGVVFSQKPGDGTTLTRDFLRRGFKEVVAFGGDGTLKYVRK